MEESEYKATYQAVNQRRCVFEKAISSRRCSCNRMLRFHLADREGISCKSAVGHELCTCLLTLMRSKARFALHITHSDEPLPHAREIRVQTGGLLGLQALLHPELQHASGVENIIGLIDSALGRYVDLESIPYEAVMQGIVRFEGRPKRGNRDR